MDISAVYTKGEDISSQHTVKFAQVLFFFAVENEPLHLQKKSFNQHLYRLTSLLCTNVCLNNEPRYKIRPKSHKTEAGAEGLRNGKLASFYHLPQSNYHSDEVCSRLWSPRSQQTCIIMGFPLHHLPAESRNEISTANHTLVYCSLSCRPLAHAQKHSLSLLKAASEYHLQPWLLANQAFIVSNSSQYT